MIKNIITDMGNVLLRFDPEVSLAACCESGEEMDVIRRELFRGPEWIMGDLGQIRNEDRYPLVAKRIPEKYHKALKNVVDGWDICMEPLLGAKEFFAGMKDAGYRIFVLSNACSKFDEYFPRHCDPGFFDGIVVSSKVKMQKPEPGIYLYLLEKYSLDPKECIFIDDVIGNVKGAKAVGIEGYLFEGDFEKLKNHIENKNKE